MSPSQGIYEAMFEEIRVTRNVQSGGGGGGGVGGRGLELRTADLHTACILQVVLTRLGCS